jgi:arylsulfatase A-like enzyme
MGRLLEALERAGIAGQTAIIVSTDHGGHLKTHGTEMVEDMTIPWVAQGAGVQARGEMKGVDISTCDTAATVLELLGLQVPPGWVGRPVREALAPPR